MAKKYLDNNGLAHFIEKIANIFVKKDGNKVLSTNDYTTAEKNKLSGIETGAQVNKIESVIVNGTTATISDKKASVTIDTGTIDSISVNGTKQTIDSNKNVDITVPTDNNQLTNGADYQTSSQVQSKINTAISGINSFDYEVVTTLPTIGKKGVIYLISNSGSEAQNIYDEYIYVNSKWEKIGTTEVNLTDYAKKTDYASSSTGGVIKVGYSTNVDSEGTIYAVERTYANYNNISKNTFISKGTLENVIAGKELQSKSDVAATLGDYYTKTETDTALSGKANTSDIPDLTDYIKNTDYPSTSKNGVIRINDSHGTNVNANGLIMATQKTYEQYNSMSGAGFVGKTTLENVITGKGLENKIENIKVNGASQTITDKAVDISVPTKNSELTNDSGYINDDRLYTMLIPDGTRIPVNENKDLNTTAYLKVGKYYNSADAEVENFTNCPTKNAFMMEVYSPLSTTIDNESTANWVYRLRILTTYYGDIYYQRVNTHGTAGIFSYQAWTKVAKTSDIPSLSNYYTKTETDTALSSKANTSSLATVATSGSYNDLTNKPTIPTVNNATLTIQKNGTTVKTFTANASSNVTANITVPTKTSDLTNDSNYVTNSGMETALADYITSANFYTTLVDYYDQYEVDTKLNAKADGNGTTGVATKTASIPFANVDSTSTSTAFTATVNGITELTDGVCVMLKNGVVTSASGWTLNINGLGAKPVYNSMTASTRITTQYNINYTMLFVYNSTRVSGGCWDMYYGYYSDANTIGHYLRPTYLYLKSKTTLNQYTIVLSYSDTEVLPIHTLKANTTKTKTLTTESFNPFGPIYWYNNSATVNANAIPAQDSLWSQYEFNLSYSFNTQGTLTTGKSVYLVAVPQDDGKAKLYSTPIAQEIPEEDNGLIYIYLGSATSADRLQMSEIHPIYYWKRGVVRAWTNPEVSIKALDKYYSKYHVDELLKSNYIYNYSELLTSVTIPASTKMKIMDYPEDGWNSNTTRVLAVKQNGNLVSTLLFPVTCESDGIYAENTDIESLTIDSVEVILVRKDMFIDKNIFYGVCNSSASASVLEVTMDYFDKIYPGMQLLVKFVNGIKNANQGLWVNGNYVGDIANDANETGVAYDVRENQLINMVFDGVYWHMLGTREANTTWYGITKLVDSVTSNSTDTAATPNSVKQAYDLANSKQNALVSGTNIKTINGNSLLGSGNIEISSSGSTTNQKTWYGTCDTAAGTATKVVSCNNFVLEDGVHLSVWFSKGNTANTASLNVNSTGAKSVAKSTSNGTAGYMWQNGEIVDFVYKASNQLWIMTKGAEATTTYYGVTKLTDSVTSTSTSAAATPNSVKQAYDLANSQKTTITTGSVTSTNIYSDGKQVYVKRFLISAFPKSTSTTISVGISQTVTLFKIEGLCQFSNGVSFQVPYIDNLYTSYNKSAKQITITTTSDRSSGSGYIDFYFTYD